MASASEVYTLQPAANQPELPEKWSPAEKWWVGAVIVIVVLVNSLPYLYGYLSTPEGMKFMGIMLDVPDHAQYFSWMRDLSTQNLVSNKLTPEPNSPLFFNLLWWALGRLGRLLGVDYAVMYQVLRVSATAIFLLLAYRICRWFLKDDWTRKTAFLLVTFTSGFGWVLIVIKYISGGELLMPLNVFIAEGNTFLGALGYPHFLAAAVYIFTFELILRGQAKNQLRYAVAAGVFALFLGWQHAYDLVTIYAILLAYALLLVIRDRKLPWYMIWSGGIVGVISVWPAIYSVWLTSFDPVWKGVLKQFANAGVYTPNPLQLPILFGITFLLALFALVRSNPLKLKRFDNGQLFVTAWFLVTFILIYLPVDYQIHLLNGWQVPMAILAAQGFSRYILPWISVWLETTFLRMEKGRLRNAAALQRWAMIGLIFVVLPTNLYLWSWRFLDLSRHTYPYYLSNAEINAMTWLEKNAKPDEVVFSSLTTGQYIPMLTGAHAYLAHWAQTLDFFGKSDRVADFFAKEAQPKQQKTILQEGNVQYIFFGPAEQALGSAGLTGLPGLTVVFSDGPVTVYQVMR